MERKPPLKGEVPPQGAEGLRQIGKEIRIFGVKNILEGYQDVNRDAVRAGFHLPVNIAGHTYASDLQLRGDLFLRQFFPAAQSSERWADLIVPILVKRWNHKIAHPLLLRSIRHKYKLILPANLCIIEKNTAHLKEGRI